MSDEIRALQVQSQAMSTRLKNRRAIENRLGAFIEAMAVPEDMVTGIMEAEVGPGEARVAWWEWPAVRWLGERVCLACAWWRSGSMEQYEHSLEAGTVLCACPLSCRSTLDRSDDRPLTFYLPQLEHTLFTST